MLWKVLPVGGEIGVVAMREVGVEAAPEVGDEAKAVLG